RLGGDDRGAQARVEGGIGQSELGRYGDFAAELGEELSTDFVLLALAMHDVLELGMAGHGPVTASKTAIWRVICGANAEIKWPTAPSRTARARSGRHRPAARHSRCRARGSGKP